MKNILFVFLLLFISPETKASVPSNGSDSAKIAYRVIAYSKGDSAIYSVSNISEIIPDMTLYIPNAFTPNGDGLNDTFGGVGVGIIEYSMAIYNRWGNLLFTSKDVNSKWDGTFMNSPVQQDVYTYQIAAKGEHTALIVKTGAVVVLR